MWLNWTSCDADGIQWDTCQRYVDVFCNNMINGGFLKWGVSKIDGFCERENPHLKWMMTDYCPHFKVGVPKKSSQISGTAIELVGISSLHCITASPVSQNSDMWNTCPKMCHTMFVAKRKAPSDAPETMWPNPGPSTAAQPSTWQVQSPCLICEKWENLISCLKNQIKMLFCSCNPW